MRNNDENRDFELHSRQIRSLLKFANLNSKDIFYDLGCGTGKIILEVVKQTNVKKVIGIENCRKNYRKARERINSFLKRNIKEIDRIDIWFGDVEDYDISDGTVIFNSINEEEDTVKSYKSQFKKKRRKIITKDLPFVGYKSKSNYESDDCWFFLMRYPFVRIRQKRLWLRLVNKDFTEFSKLYEYYENQLRDRDIARKQIVYALLELQKMVNRRF